MLRRSAAFCHSSCVVRKVGGITGILFHPDGGRALRTVVLPNSLGGILTGMRLSSDQDGLALGDTKVGHFVMAIDPTLFMTLEAFGMGVQTYIDRFKAQPGTYAAGGPEWERRRLREAEGIPLPDGLYAELAAGADKAGVPLGF